MANQKPFFDQDATFAKFNGNLINCTECYIWNVIIVSTAACLQFFMVKVTSRTIFKIHKIPIETPYISTSHKTNIFWEQFVKELGTIKHKHCTTKWQCDSSLYD